MAQNITYTLHELVSALDSYADELLRSEYDISFNQFQFLAILSTEQPSDLSHLATCLGVTRAAVSKRVPSLVAGGWITTSSDPSNARRVMISLTPAAEELVRLASAELEEAFTAMFADPRLNPDVTPGAISVTALNTHLSTLTSILHNKGYCS